MNNHILDLLLEKLPKICVFIVFIYGLSQARRVTNDISSNADKIAKPDDIKILLIHKALFNFYLILALIFTVCIRYLELIANDLFIGIMIAIFTGLGVKLTQDVIGSHKN